MAITRYDINGSLTALQAALLATGLFDSVTLDSDSTPTLLTCKDADANTLFTVASGTQWTYTVYKDESTTVLTQGTTSTASPVYCYKVGSDSAVIQHPSNIFLVISKTNTGGVGFAIPQQFSTTANKGAFKVGCWGDDTLLTTPLVFATTSTSDVHVGNQCQMVEISMHGTYDQPLYLASAYYLPMAQVGMRGVVQELTTERGTYLTNGYVALLDD